jgi:hypothetical protein
MTFYIPTPSEYVREHDRFISALIVAMSLEEEEIKYEGVFPPDVEEVKLSDYLNLHGCVPNGNGFIGYFGYKSYKDIVQHFICEASMEYRGTPYYIVLDVPKSSQSSESVGRDLTLTVERIIKQNKSMIEDLEARA